MSKNNQRDERNWRRQQQNRQGQNPRYGGSREGDYGSRGQNQEGQNWRDEDYNRRSGQEMDPQWSRGRGTQGMPDQWGSGNERETWEGGAGHRWGNETPNWGRERNYGTEGRERGWDRGNEGSPSRTWQGDQGRQTGSQQGRHWENWNEPYQGMGGRGWEEGWDDAMHRGEGQHVGRGPRNYKRSDNRIEEDINERLTQHGMIDATEIEVTVQNGEVILRGNVDSREAKRLAEDIADSVFGVKEVNNQIKMKQKPEWEETKHETDTSGKQRKAS